MAVLQVNAFFKKAAPAPAKKAAPKKAAPAPKKAAPKKAAPKKAAPVRKSSGKRGDGVDLGKWYGEQSRRRPHVFFTIDDG